MSPARPSAPVRPPAISVGLGLLVLAVAFQVAHTVGGAGPQSQFVEYWLFEVVIAGGMALSLARVILIEQDRAAWICFTAALAIYLAGDVYWNVVLADVDAPPMPSPADAAWLLFYVPAFAGVTLLLRKRSGRLRLSEWLDGLIAVLAMTAVTVATLLDPIVDRTGGDRGAAITNLLYPVADLVLIIFATTALAFLGWKVGRGWLTLIAGLIVFGVADAGYVIPATGSEYVEGSWLDAGWPLAATLFAFAAWQPMSPAVVRRSERVPEHLLAGSFAAMALVVLAADLFVEVNLAAQILALSAMATSVLRLAIAAHDARQSERSRRRQARTDELTGLANRRGFYAHVKQRLREFELTGAGGALLLMDLDHFKEFNDSLGHAAGDMLLKEVASRLESVVPDGAVLARIGGDEFVVMLAAGSTRDQATATAAAARDALAEPLHLSGILCHVDASIGIALTPAHGSDRSTLLRRADIAMYMAKKDESSIVVFDESHERTSIDHIELAAELRNAIDRGELVLHYQPQARLSDGAIEAVEALVRWQHPAHGLLMPANFLPLGERYGLMRRMSRLLIADALEQQRRWRRAGRDITIAVNLADADLLDDGFPDEVAALLSRYGTPRGRLRFEITENTVMADPQRVLATLAELGSLGIAFALDDYGTGHSSLAHLKRLPVRELKIDRSFIRDVTTSREDEVIVRSTIDLAHNLGMEVVAEGVESAEHWTWLRAVGCDTAQGYHLARPLPAAELDDWLDGTGSSALKRPA